MHRYKWAYDGIGVNMISRDICSEHSNVSLDNLCDSLENTLNNILLYSHCI